MFVCVGLLLFPAGDPDVRCTVELGDTETMAESRGRSKLLEHWPEAKESPDLLKCIAFRVDENEMQIRLNVLQEFRDGETWDTLSAEIIGADCVEGTTN